MLIRRTAIGVVLALLVALPALAMDKLDKMELVFTGDYKREEIKVALDRVMKLHSLEINDVNYNKTASVLIVLRKSQGVSEMDILKCMYHAGNPANIGFGESAAFCAVAISPNR